MQFSSKLLLITITYCELFNSVLLKSHHNKYKYLRSNTEDNQYSDTKNLKKSNTISNNLSSTKASINVKSTLPPSLTEPTLVSSSTQAKATISSTLLTTLSPCDIETEEQKINKTNKMKIFNYTVGNIVTTEKPLKWHTFDNNTNTIPPIEILTKHKNETQQKIEEKEELKKDEKEMAQIREKLMNNESVKRKVELDKEMYDINSNSTKKKQAYDIPLSPLRSRKNRNYKKRRGDKCNKNKKKIIKKRKKKHTKVNQKIKVGKKKPVYLKKKHKVKLRSLMPFNNSKRSETTASFPINYNLRAQIKNPLPIDLKNIERKIASTEQNKEEGKKKCPMFSDSVIRSLQLPILESIEPSSWKVQLQQDSIDFILKENNTENTNINYSETTPSTPRNTTTTTRTSQSTPSLLITSSSPTMSSSISTIKTEPSTPSAVFEERAVTTSTVCQATTEDLSKNIKVSIEQEKPIDTLVKLLRKDIIKNFTTTESPETASTPSSSTFNLQQTTVSEEVSSESVSLPTSTRSLETEFLTLPSFNKDYKVSHSNYKTNLNGPYVKKIIEHENKEKIIDKKHGKKRINETNEKVIDEIVKKHKKLKNQDEYDKNKKHKENYEINKSIEKQSKTKENDGGKKVKEKKVKEKKLLDKEVVKISKNSNDKSLKERKFEDFGKMKRNVFKLNDDKLDNTTDLLKEKSDLEKNLLNSNVIKSAATLTLLENNPDEEKNIYDQSHYKKNEKLDDNSLKSLLNEFTIRGGIMDKESSYDKYKNLRNPVKEIAIKQPIAFETDNFFSEKLKNLSQREDMRSAYGKQHHSHQRSHRHHHQHHQRSYRNDYKKHANYQNNARNDAHKRYDYQTRDEFLPFKKADLKAESFVLRT